MKLLRALRHLLDAAHCPRCGLVWQRKVPDGPACPGCAYIAPHR